MNADSNPPERRVVVRPGDVRRSGEFVRGTRAGNRVYRVARPPATQQIVLPKIVARRRTWHPAVVFVNGFAGLIALGAVLLMLPFSSASGEWTPPLVALFTATSAVCVTGLVVVDTGTYWSLLGQVLILVMIQVGGFGFMTSSTLLLILFGRRASLRERLLLREALGGGELGSVRYLVGKIVLFTLVVEVIGGLLLTARFLAEHDVPQAVWWGFFHAISAFNNAGFDLIGGFRSLTPFSHDAWVLLTVAGLLILGGISYSLIEDVAEQRRWVRLTLDSKLILVTTAALVLLGMLGILFAEWDNSATLGGMELGPRLLNGFFHSVTPRTAGFNSLDLAAMTEPGLLITIALMFVGGASGSTAGGIKVQTFSLLFFAIVSAVRGLPDVQAFRRRVPVPTVLRATSVALIALAVIFVVSLAINVFDRQFVFLRVFFEAVSAFATVGLSTGITPELGPDSLVVLILTMFAGRVGPLTLVLALAARERRTTYHWPEETPKIG